MWSFLPPDVFAWIRGGFSWAFALFGFLSGHYLFWRKSEEEHLNTWQLTDAWLRAIVVGIVAARIGAIALHLDQFGLDLWRWINIVQYPGLWGPVGIAAGGYVLVRAARSLKTDVMQVTDFACIAAAWFLAWWWLSRFAIGVGAGRATSLPWGMVMAERLEPAHPLPLYAFPVFLFLTWYLWWAEPRYRFFFWYRSKKRTAKTGYLTGVFLIVVGLLGFLLSFVQYPLALFMDIDINQGIHGLIFLLGCGLVYVRSGRSWLGGK